MSCFDNSNTKPDMLRKEAYNLHWAEVAGGAIPLATADMDYPCAPAIKQTLFAYVEEGCFPHIPKLGLPAFNQTFSNYMEEAEGEEIKAEQVLTVDSIARAMFIVAKAFPKPGDRITTFNPRGFLPRGSCLAAETTPISYAAELDTEGGEMGLPRLEEYVSEKTRVAKLRNPYSSYNLIYTKEELETTMRLCEKHDLLIMNDEM